MRSSEHTIDHTHVRKLRKYPVEWISDAIETYTEWMLFAKPWINYRGLYFDRSDFVGIDEKQGLIKFLDTVHAGEQA